MGVSEITLEISDVDQLLIAPDSLFYGKRMLAPDAEKVVIEEATMASSKDQIHIRIYLHYDELISRKDEMSTAIHQHFAYRRKKSQSQLKTVLQLGWRSLLISFFLKMS